MFLVKLLQSKITLTLKKAKSTMDLRHWLCPDLCCLRSKWLLWEDKCTQHQLCSLLPGCQVFAVKYSKGLHIIEWGQALPVPYSNNWGSLSFKWLSSLRLCGLVLVPVVAFDSVVGAVPYTWSWLWLWMSTGYSSGFLSWWLVTRNYRACFLDWRWCDQMFFKTGLLIPRPSILGAQ